MGSPCNWIGVGFDGFCAEWHGWQGPGHIGDAIPGVAERIQCWLDDGFDIKIVTARASSKCDDAEDAVAMVREWCLVNFGREFEVTAEIDPGMVEFWDSRAVGVVTNTCRRCDGLD